MRLHLKFGITMTTSSSSLSRNGLLRKGRHSVRINRDALTSPSWQTSTVSWYRESSESEARQSGKRCLSPLRSLIMDAVPICKRFDGCSWNEMKVETCASAFEIKQSIFSFPSFVQFQAMSAFISHCVCNSLPQLVPQTLSHTLCSDAPWSEEKMCKKWSTSGSFFTPLCRFIWMTKADLWRNALEHKLHWNSFMSRWIFRWFWSVCESKKPLPQFSQSHLCGLSPVCFIRWRFR